MLDGRLSLSFALALASSSVASAADTPAATQAPSPRPELELKQIAFADSEHEISGIIAAPGADHEAFVVADSPDDVFIYRLKLKPQGKVKAKGKEVEGAAATSTFTLNKVLGLPVLAGWSDVQEAMKEQLKLDVKDRRLDLEGIAACDGTWYLANERARQILEVAGAGTEGRSAKAVRALPIDLEAGFPGIWEGGANAGIEGIAVDCAKGRLYIGKEREPRAILVVDMKTWKVTGTIDLPPSDRDGQKVINPFTGEGLFTLSADVSDLTIADGFLYALERNAYEIAKIDLTTQKVVARVSYYRAEKPLYETGEPFGVAEALAVTKDEIWVGIDNNESPLTRFALKTYDAKGAHPAIMIFKRPQGF